MLFQLNWMQRSLYWTCKEIPFLSKRSPCGLFLCSPLAFYALFFFRFQTWMFITFIIIYWKISCIEMKCLPKTLGPCLQVGKFSLWKIHKMQPSLWSLRFQLCKMIICTEGVKSCMDSSLTHLCSYQDPVIQRDCEYYNALHICVCVRIVKSIDYSLTFVA